MLKKTILILSFVFIFLPKSSIIYAQSGTNIPTITVTPQTETPWTQFWGWIFSFFIKTDYQISHRPLNEVTNDLTNYGDVTDEKYKDKHLSAGPRSLDVQSHNCLKGNIIKNVILDNVGYPDSDLSTICFNSETTQDQTCDTITTKDLAHYFVQIKQKFYCSDINNQFIDIESNVIDKVNQLYSTDIPQNQFESYQQIYNDNYLTLKNPKNDDANTKKIVQTPLPNESQDPNDSNSDIYSKLNQSLMPYKADWDSSNLEFLRPATNPYYNNGW